MQFPRLSPPACAVALAELHTGHILATDRSVWRRDAPKPVWLVFETVAAARTFCRNTVRRDPHIECILYDHDGNGLEVWEFDEERGEHVR